MLLGDVRSPSPLGVTALLVPTSCPFGPEGPQRHQHPQAGGNGRPGAGDRPLCAPDLFTCGRATVAWIQLGECGPASSPLPHGGLGGGFGKPVPIKAFSGPEHLPE